VPYLDDARRLYFRHWSAHSATASVLLLHGFGEHSGHFHRLAHDLNRHGLDVWGLDHLGHGLSVGERGLFGSVDALADNAAALLDAIETDHPDRPLFVVGHSLGGVTAALLAARGRRLSGLVLTGCPLSGLPAGVSSDAVMSEDPFYLDALATDPLGFDTVPAEEALWTAIEACGPELRERLGGVKVPVLFVNGDRDVFAPVAETRAWAARLPHAEVVVVEGHHDIVNDVSHHQVADEIGTFVVRHAACTTAAA
jgi:alpha-beta hydrolase superfamily lysophospholipase